MPNQFIDEDQRDDEFEDSEEETEDTEGSEESQDSEKPKSGDPDKRIKDLQSKADAAEARANKAEKALAKALGRGESAAPGSNDPEREALMTELREAGLDAIFAETPILKQYDIDRSLIEGRTRAEMRESAASLVSLIKSVETKARNAALKDAGVTPAPSASTRSLPKNFAEMSDEEFEKFVANSTSGGAPIW